MTKAEVQALIDLNLASESTITAIKHREVENALLDFMDAFSASKILAKGTVTVGDVGDPSTIAVTFPSTLADTNYVVSGSLVSNGTLSSDSNCFWMVRNKTTSGFTLVVQETSRTTQNLSFDYVVFKR
jgi:hypothetical protein